MLTIMTTHPIQYQIPIWQALAADGRVPFEVWYLTNFGVEVSRDREFGEDFRWDIDTLSGYPHRFLASGPGAVPSDFRKCRVTENLRDRLSQSGAKAVWIQGWQVLGYWQAAWAAKAVGAELWLRAESNDLAATPYWKRMIKRPVLGQLFSRVDRFLCIGSANRRLYRAYGVPDDRLLAAPYAVDNDRFARQASALRGDRAGIRREWGIADDAFCVLFCGKFIAKKRPLDLVKAAQILGKGGRLPNVHLLFAGAGELEDELRGACDVAYDRAAQDSDGRNGAKRPRATFTGFLNQTEISRAYVAADCLVLPSDHGETWGLVVNEAMASGLPCTVSRACGCSEDIVEGGLSFSVGDVGALADRLEVLYRRSVSREQRPLPTVADTVRAVVAAYDGASRH
jgi:glycosyltransferase involved in cell wall biosynthesis